MGGPSFERTPDWAKCQRPFTLTPAFSSAPDERVFFPEPSDETRVLEHEARAHRSPNFVAKETFTFCEMLMFERLRKYREDKFNFRGPRLGHFLLVRCLKSVDWRSGRLPRPGDFWPMIEESMSITPMIFVLVILLFGFDSTGQVKTRRQHHHG